MPMKRSTVSGLLVAATALVGASLTGEAGAQTLDLPRSRQGYYVGGGLHFGASRFEEDGDKLGTWFTQTIRGRVGQMVTDDFGLGLSLGMGGAGKESEVASLFDLGAEGQWELATNLALHGGVGFGVITVSDEDKPNEDLRGSFGGAYSVGLSYDWFPFKPRLTGGWGFRPVATAQFLPNDPVSAMIFTLGVEVVYWKGLPKNELNLPPGEGYEK